ncbi:FosX/FosE/FosI family fosfomycin resistance thiol transferase [Roseovarius faecimaris]|uniref:FosX/FosE/FosI family fosfomycin resistance thiol transferase n=1 Tax=Roseovarius faecimaris TaxID=2494550 RepID=A0A6I6IT67_9RHOB|nr:FosX/FosE/FosI family fosfomycin resistance hydrolase [Roseovarius faecimaris]QGX99392.1 FosX/FosE/FosI family fosfomycin resistance thiol transferase [Roseovarius faecimaris]
MSVGLSHITLITADLDRMQALVETVLKGRCVYDSGKDTFSLSEERFFLVGDIWLATMKGAPLTERSYNHIAFQIDEDEFDDRQTRILSLGLELRPPRPRVEGEGRSLYFYGPDNHLFELHTGTLEQRLRRYAEGRRAT